MGGWLPVLKLCLQHHMALVCWDTLNTCLGAECSCASRRFFTEFWLTWTQIANKSGQELFF